MTPSPSVFSSPPPPLLPPLPPPLMCPMGWFRHPKSSHIPDTGLVGEHDAYNTAESIDACAEQCIANSDCSSFEFVPQHRYTNSSPLFHNVCNLHRERGPIGTWESEMSPDYVLCGPVCPAGFKQYPPGSDVGGCGF